MFELVKGDLCKHRALSGSDIVFVADSNGRVMW